MRYVRTKYMTTLQLKEVEKETMNIKPARGIFWQTARQMRGTL